MLTQSNAHELTQIAREADALVLRGPLLYPGPDWEIGPEALSEYLYQPRDRQMLVILAAVDGEPVRLCGTSVGDRNRPTLSDDRCAGSVPAAMVGG